MTTEVSASDREAWLEARLRYLTASEVAIALKVEPGRGKLLKVKAGLVPANDDIGDLAQVAAGRHLEAGIFAWFAEDTIHMSAGMHGRLMEHPRNARLAATPDALLDAEPVELKMVGETAVVNWFTGGQKLDRAGRTAWEVLEQEPPRLLDSRLVVPPENTTTSDDKDDLRTLWRRKRGEQLEVWYQLRRSGYAAPVKYQIQLQVQMDVLGVDQGWIVGCLGGTRRLDLLYQKSDALLDAIHDETQRFWDDVKLLQEKHS